VEFLETVWEGTRVDVNRCSLFTPPTAVDCDKGCLQIERPAESWVLPPGSA
jgi:hypothetical protein